MCPLADSPVLAHARCAHARIEAGVNALLGRLGDAESHELKSGLASLVECLASLETASEAQVPARWSRFFMCYDHALATLRDCEKLARDSA
jgi:hypothetical protein